MQEKRVGQGNVRQPSCPDTLFFGANRASSLTGGMEQKSPEDRLPGRLCRLQATGRAD
jgi:hypothetical protein